MTTYIMLANWTDRGVQTAKDSPNRVDTARKMLKEMGGDFAGGFLDVREIRFAMRAEWRGDADEDRIGFG